MRVLQSFVLALVVALPSAAHAYRRTTIDVAPDRAIFWESRDITIELASSTSSDVAPADLRAALDRSLATWTLPACSDIVLTDVGEALATSTNLVGSESPDGVNRIVVREDDWPEEAGPETLALATVIYSRSDGHVIDADIDLNGASHFFTTSDEVTADADDVENTLTHELGHVLGFAHVMDPDATMFASALPGESLKRDLSPDDVLALCETYPTDGPTPLLPPAPPPSSCCAVPSGSRSPWLALIAAVSVRAATRRRRRARVDETAS